MLSSRLRNVATPLLVVVLCVASAKTAFVQTPTEQRFTVLRNQMVDENIVREGVTNPRVVKAMRTIPRHEFVPPDLRYKAYLDSALPIGGKQTISPPFIVAYMTEVIDPQPTDRVLEIGTGSGYQAAVLSPLAKEVYSIEIVPELGRTAATRLQRLGYRNVKTKVGDGYKGWEEYAPFDKIIVTCSPEKVPDPLIEQLKEGGRMIIPLGERYQQVFHTYEKKNGELVQKRLIPTMFVPMTGISEAKREVLPNNSKPEIVNGSFELDKNNDNRTDHWYYQRQVSLNASDVKDGEYAVQFDNADPTRLSQMLQGIGVDGSKVGSLRVSLWVKGYNAMPNLKALEKPSLMIHFFDKDRRSVGTRAIGPWLGTFQWTRVSSTLQVPPNANEAVIRIGLNGSTGRLLVDGIKMTPIPRR